ncbi:hypothetical protein SUGI_0647040 [Cryptomeria japonica]|nr:hypothetical protein SUGI_0647040 [Cryptomeria japonica]
MEREKACEDNITTLAFVTSKMKRQNRGSKNGRRSENSNGMRAKFFFQPFMITGLHHQFREAAIIDVSSEVDMND